MQKETNTKILIAVPLVLVAALAYVLIAKVLLPQEAAPVSGITDSEEMIPASLGESMSEGSEITFEDAPDIKVMKRKSDDAYAYDFMYKDKVFGHVDLTGDWHIEHFLSYESGNDYFGFSMSDSGIDNKYYWGPTSLYKANTEQGSLTKTIDFSLITQEANGEEVTSNSWETNFFITDMSEDEKQVVYCNYWTDNNKIFIKDTVTGKTKEFSVDAGLYDFGDAMLSEDGKKIAFAGVKRTDEAGAENDGFIESDIFIIDVASGAISTHQTNKTPGYYVVSGWQDGEADYDYVTEE